ncbi:MAG: phospholipase D/Transphosphatidylase, partial [Elusimicrobia bacterium]
VSAREGLRTAVNAVAGDEKAGREKPALSALGGDAQAPKADGSAGDQREQAESFFTQKAGGRSSVYALGDDADPDTAPGAPSGSEAAKPKKPGKGKGKGKGKAEPAPVPDPVYPARTVTFNGVDFPATAFRPDRPTGELIVRAINAAKTSIDISVYEFKNREILKALREAKARGVKIRVIVDFGNTFPSKRDDSTYWPSRSLELQSMLSEGFDVTISRGIEKWGISHNKVAVFDGAFALAGSYNWSFTSEDNHFENLFFTDDKKNIAGLQAYWDYLRSLGVPFDQAKAHAWPQTAPTPPRDANPSVVFNGVALPSYVFSPDSFAEDTVVKALDAAKKSIDVSMFTLTSPRVVRALAAAKDRGVKVRVLVDQSQHDEDFMKPFVDWLAFHGIPVKVNAGPNVDGPEWAEKNHNKFAVLDGKLVLSGSTNWTKSGFYTNFDNIFMLTDATDVKGFAMFFDDMFKSKRAERHIPPASEPTLPTDEEVMEGLRGQPKPLPPAPVWGPLPEARQVSFNGETFPAAAARPVHPIKDLLIKAIDTSKTSIELALYEFNLDDILQALRRAQKRGVKVRVIIDYNKAFPKGRYTDGEERERNEQISALLKEFETKILRGTRMPGIMHNKFAVFDGKFVEWGSYNWSYTAEFHHFEHIQFSDEKARTSFYGRYWEWMWGYAPPEDKAEDHDWAGERPAGAPLDEDKVLELNGQRFPRQVFSPQGLAEETVVRAIQAAKVTVEVAMFSFYSARIAEELLAAKKRGVEVRLVLDRMQSKLMKLDDWFAFHGFDVRILGGPDPYGNVYFEKNHSKMVIVDGKLLAAGSFNYTANAETNSYENVGLTMEPADVAFFMAYFKMLYDNGWKPKAPKRLPEGTPEEPEAFFGRERLQAMGWSSED